MYTPNKYILGFHLQKRLMIPFRFAAHVPGTREAPIQGSIISFQCLSSRTNPCTFLLGKSVTLVNLLITHALMLTVELLLEL